MFAKNAVWNLDRKTGGGQRGRTRAQKGLGVLRTKLLGANRRKESYGLAQGDQSHAGDRARVVQPPLSGGRTWRHEHKAQGGAIRRRNGQRGAPDIQPGCEIAQVLDGIKGHLRIVGAQGGQPGVFRRLAPSAGLQQRAAGATRQFIDATGKKRRTAIQRLPCGDKAVLPLDQRGQAVSGCEYARGATKLLGCRQQIVRQKDAALEPPPAHIGKKHEQIRPGGANPGWMRSLDREKAFGIPNDILDGGQQVVAFKRNAHTIFHRSLLGAEEQVAARIDFRMHEQHWSTAWHKIGNWSGRRESNPRKKHGKLLFCH